MSIDLRVVKGSPLSLPTAIRGEEAPGAQKVASVARPIIRPAPGGRLSSIFPRIVVYNPKLDKLILNGAQPEKIAEGLEWTEGPVWNKKEGCLLFSDIPRNSIFKWKEGQNLSLFLYPSGYTGRTPYAGKEPGSNGLAFDNNGTLHACQHGDRRVVAFDRDKNAIPVAETYEGKKLNSPNDLVFNSAGVLYFTDPAYGLPLRGKDPEKQLPFSGIYRVKNGQLELLTKELGTPNGLAFSPDEKYLYVSNSGEFGTQDHPAWYRFAVKDDGTLGDKKLLFDATKLKEVLPGSPDGLKVDLEGNLYCCGPGGLYIFSPEAELLGVVEFGTPTSNCNWGDDGSRLYITANHAVYRLQCRNKGAGFVGPSKL